MTRTLHGCQFSGVFSVMLIYFQVINTAELWTNKLLATMLQVDTATKAISMDPSSNTGVSWAIKAARPVGRGSGICPTARPLQSLQPAIAANQPSVQVLSGFKALV